jgi:hypothetical protein
LIVDHYECYYKTLDSVFSLIILKFAYWQNAVGRCSVEVGINPKRVENG